jgi:hypothetical protein
MRLDNDAWLQEFDKRTGELFQVEFFRVVLDEAHAIKNHRARSKYLPSYARVKALSTDRG